MYTVVMTLRRWPNWLIGGVVGVIYLLVIFIYEFSSPGCHFTAKEMCGFMTAMFNFPSVWIWEYLDLPWFDFGYDSPVTVVLGILPIMVLNFGLGALIIGGLLRLFRKS